MSDSGVSPSVAIAVSDSVGTTEGLSDSRDTTGGGIPTKAVVSVASGYPDGGSNPTLIELFDPDDIDGVDARLRELGVEDDGRHRHRARGTETVDTTMRETWIEGSPSTSPWWLSVENAATAALERGDLASGDREAMADEHPALVAQLLEERARSARLERDIEVLQAGRKTLATAFATAFALKVAGKA